MMGREEIRLQGINVPSLEWSNEGENVLKSTRVAMDDWGSNCIRLPLSQDRWFGWAQWQTDGGEAYRKLVDQVLAEVRQRKGWLVLDLHWSNGGVKGKHMQQHAMPDQYSKLFWEDLATRYKNDPVVLFDLYNEPRDVSWNVWQKGGSVTNGVDGGGTVTYESPGMQGLVDAIRAKGAKNVVVIGGLDWAYDLTGVLQGHEIKDPKGNGVMYASHIYPWKTDWDGKVGRVADRHPVLIGEVGCEPDPKQEDPAIWAPRMLDWIEKRKIHWTAWCFHPTASPRMLKDWDYTPTDYWGAPVKQVLLKSKVRRRR